MWKKCASFLFHELLIAQTCWQIGVVNHICSRWMVYNIKYANSQAHQHINPSRFRCRPKNRLPQNKLLTKIMVPPEDVRWAAICERNFSIYCLEPSTHCFLKQSIASISMIFSFAPGDSRPDVYFSVYRELSWKLVYFLFLDHKRGRMHGPSESLHSNWTLRHDPHTPYSFKRHIMHCEQKKNGITNRLTQQGLHIHLSVC